MRLLPFRRHRAGGADEPQRVVPVDDPPGAVRFWTDMAKRRFIRMQAMGDAVAFVAPWISFALYTVVALLWVVPDRRIERTLVR